MDADALFGCGDAAGLGDPVDGECGEAERLRGSVDALAAAGAPGTALTPAIEFATRALRRRAIVFVVSDFLDDGWQHAMTLCGARHDVVAVQMLAPEMVSPPDLGLAEVRDPETGVARLVDWSDRGQRARYAEAALAFRERTREGLRRAGVDVMEAPIPRRFDRNAVARSRGPASDAGSGGLGAVCPSQSGVSCGSLAMMRS